MIRPTTFQIEPLLTCQALKLSEVVEGEEIKQISSLIKSQITYKNSVCNKKFIKIEKVFYYRIFETAIGALYTADECDEHSLLIEIEENNSKKKIHAEIQNVSGPCWSLTRVGKSDYLLGIFKGEIKERVLSLIDFSQSKAVNSIPFEIVPTNLCIKGSTLFVIDLDKFYKVEFEEK